MMEQLNLFGFSEVEDADLAQKKRMSTYDKEWCYQYDIRIRNRKEDLVLCGLTEEDVKDLKISDFDFYRITSKEDKKACIDFIKKHEWLGNISQYTTHWFVAKYKNIYAGVILMNLPNAFSKLLGDDTDKIERLISRGACISWSPKCLASTFLMWCIRWMVDNTEYRLFTAYSDPTAKELGTIYQACNFYYLGQNSGTTIRYINPYNGKIVSDRFFRQKSAYRHYAKELGIKWHEDWFDEYAFSNVPKDIELQLRLMSKKKMDSSKKIEYPSKHKYAYVLGKDKRETKYLRKRFEELNKTYPYPKKRGE